MDRHTFIKFGYTLHYGMFTFILLLMYISGAFTKSDQNEWYTAKTMLGIREEDVECTVGIRIWFFMFILLCPLAVFIGACAGRRAKHNYHVRTYTLETWKR